MARHVVTYADDVSRWEPDARERLERAALELFVAQGFTETTVPQITARAGLTTRTFFRHYTDKREVLFAHERELPELVARLMAEAPASLGPVPLIEQGLVTIATTRFEGRLHQLRARRGVVRSDEGLRERELRKLSVLAEAIRGGFLDRGLDELSATLAAHAAVTAVEVGIGRWLDQDGERAPAGFLLETLGALRTVLAGEVAPVEVRVRGVPAPARPPGGRAAVGG